MRGHVAITMLTTLVLAGMIVLIGCGAPKPKGSVTAREMQTVRSTFGDLKVGTSKNDALAAFSAGNKVKLSSAAIGGETIEEWKIEAVREAKPRNDLFISFLYFCNDRLVDISDTRVDFRARPELVAQWAAGK